MISRARSAWALPARTCTSSSAPSREAAQAMVLKSLTSSR
ncbi:hypothetical protein CSC42_5703 [Pseudomonas aeruginosa]|nr:hypothetical protein CSC42_5703 [Pseudomonas aeruginosa]